MYLELPDLLLAEVFQNKNVCTLYIKTVDCTAGLNACINAAAMGISTHLSLTSFSKVTQKESFCTVGTIFGLCSFNTRAFLKFILVIHLFTLTASFAALADLVI